MILNHIANKITTVAKQIFTMKVLNVAEKNDSAKNISEIMARGRYNR